jgi:mRNA interferase MazF
MSPRPGEVWLADLGLAAKTRPVVIVSRNDPEPPRALVLYVRLTAQDRHSSYEVRLPPLPFLDRDSIANVQGMGSLSLVRLERRLGLLPNHFSSQAAIVWITESASQASARLPTRQTKVRATRGARALACRVETLLDTIRR